MNPEEIKQKLDEADIKLRAKLAELGFSPEEVERQLDRSVPDDVKQAERDAVLQRKFNQELEDPNSGLMDAIIARAADELEKQLPELEARARRDRARRTKMIIGGVAAAAAIAGLVAYFALRDTRTSCEKLVGPMADLEKLVGQPLEMRSGHETKYSCYQYVDKRDHAGGFAVDLETERGTGNFDYQRREQADRKFTDQKTFHTDLGEAVLFVAGDDTKISTEALTADIRSRVGTTSDPTGAALAALPPSQHVVLMKTASKTIKLSVDRELFTAENAMLYAKQIATRAK